jgi:hypothetical protein
VSSRRCRICLTRSAALYWRSLMRSRSGKICDTLSDGDLGRPPEKHDTSPSCSLAQVKRQ